MNSFNPQKNNILKSAIFWILICVLLTLLLMSVSKLSNAVDLPVQVAGVLLEVIITVSLMALLYKHQEHQNQQHDLNMKVFEKKQKVYHDFLKHLHAIVQDGRIIVGEVDQMSGADGQKSYAEAGQDELKDFIFQLSYLQMHESQGAITEIVEEATKIAHTLYAFRDIKTLRGDAVRLASSEFYSDLSRSVFAITRRLSMDLYGVKDDEVASKDSVEKLLLACGVLSPKKSQQMMEAHGYFLKQLCDSFRAAGCRLLIENQLNDAGKNLPPDFERDQEPVLVERQRKKIIQDYYMGTPDRSKIYRLSVDCGALRLGENSAPLPVTFNVWVLGTFYHYGFKVFGTMDADAQVAAERLFHAADASLSALAAHQIWFRKPEDGRHGINFWRDDDTGFKKLLSVSEREKFVAEICRELTAVVERVKKFQTPLSDSGQKGP